MVGGAIGNLIDRMTQPPGLLRGGVIDFIQAFNWFPIFNIADACITVGGIGLVLTMARSQEPNSGVDATSRASTTSEPEATGGPDATSGPGSD